MSFWLTSEAYQNESDEPESNRQQPSVHYIIILFLCILNATNQQKNEIHLWNKQCIPQWRTHLLSSVWQPLNSLPLDVTSDGVMCHLRKNTLAYNLYAVPDGMHVYQHNTVHPTLLIYHLYASYRFPMFIFMVYLMRRYITHDLRYKGVMLSCLAAMVYAYLTDPDEAIQNMWKEGVQKTIAMASRELCEIYPDTNVPIWWSCILPWFPECKKQKETKDETRPQRLDRQTLSHSHPRISYFLCGRTVLENCITNFLGELPR